MPSVLPREMTAILTYDAENRMITFGGSWTYVYDSFGRRIQRTDSASNHYDALYDLAGHLETEYYNGGWNRTEIFAGSMHLATYVNSSNQTYFHNTDWLGSERATTDSSGVSRSTCSALPFADGEGCSPNQIANALFTGDEHDAESNTEHTLFRQLSGTQGRWLSPDPYMGSMDITNPQSMNRYAYVNNDPTDETDPDGLDPRVDQVADSGGISSTCRNRFEYSGRAIAVEFCNIAVSIAGAVIGGLSGGGGDRGGEAVPGTGHPIYGKPPLSGETGGLPNGFHFQQLSLCQAAGLCPLGPACDFGGCGATGNGFQAAVVVGACAADLPACIAVTVSAALLLEQQIIDCFRSAFHSTVVGILAILVFSKKHSS
jgi:RHS repeat-associated protein